MLDVGVGLAISNHHRRKIDFDNVGVGLHSKVFVLLVDDARKIRHVSATIALRSKMEGVLPVLRVSLQEELKESVDVFASSRARVDRRTIVRVRVTNIDGLVQENDVGIGVPTVRVVGDVMTFIRDPARTKLEEQTSRR